MEMSNVNDLISGLEAAYVGDHALSTDDAPGFTNTCYTCECITK